jgi:hypothetical protein
MKLALVGIVVALAGCPPTTPAPVEPAGATIPSVDYTWKIIGHVLTPDASIDERDAVAWNGREIAVTRTSYASPFQGTCESSGRVRRNRSLEEVISEVNAPRSVVIDFALADPIVEYRLTCRDRGRPSLAMFVGAERALTCFSGVCYVLRR